MVADFGRRSSWPRRDNAILMLLHASGTVFRFASLQHHLYRLFQEKAEAVFVQPQFPVLIYCSLYRRLCSWPTPAFGLNALLVN